ncbi:MAG: translation initiation factor IF-3 [Patescibacteria group bacterium]|nr:translation initiation factor IF-3 [Patescibacteria group bacterium]
MRRIYRRAKPTPEKAFRANHQITAPVIFLIDESGNMTGATPIDEALRMAEEAELDLVEVNPTAELPICKIIDYGQFKYERDKKSQKQKVKAKKTDTKCVRLSVRIGEHDFNVRLNQAKGFLIKGDKVKIEIRLRGRERQHPELAAKVINNFYNQLKNFEELNILIEENLTNQGASFNMLVANKK